MADQPIPPTAGQIRTTATPSPSFAEHLTADERNQLDARAACAEQERDEALDDLSKTREQLADAYAAAARSATEADQLRKQCHALEDARRQLSTEVTKWKTRLVDETDRLRDRLDRANAAGKQLAQELATMTDVAQGNARHVVMLMNVLDRIEKLTVDGDTDLTPEMTVTVGEILRALNEPSPAPLTAPPVRPGSSRRAQEEGRIDTEWWNRRALISDTLGRALWKRGHVVPLSVRDRCAEAVLAALDTDALPDADRAQDEPQPARTARRLLDQAIDTALPEAGGRVRKLLKALRRELARVDALRAIAGNPEYLIWSHHHQCWWGPNGSGYRRDITNAGRYTLADTKKWLGRGCGCCPVPEVVVPAPGPEVLTPAGRTDRWVAEQIEQATRARTEAGQTNPYVTQSLPTNGGRP